jgi:uncharacterized phage-associated protein
MKRKAEQTALDVANAFIALAKRDGKPLSNMQLQKLVYIAFGYYLAIFNSKLFDDEIQAWYMGPVIPNLYHALKKYGANEVTNFLESENVIEVDSPEMKVIESVWESYSNFDGIELSSLTHQEGTPWSAVWEERKKQTEIPIHLIRSHYERLFKEKVNAD